MMEIQSAIILGVCVIFIVLAYLFGKMEQRKASETMVERVLPVLDAEIERLTLENADLRRSLYHRIGYHPEQKVENEVVADRIEPQNTFKRHDLQLPDIYRRRQEVWAKEAAQKEKEGII